MKNAINYYYNLIVNDIHQSKKTYYFDYDNSRYYLILYKDNPKDLNYIYELHRYILTKGLYVHQIILNKNGEILTFINNEPYILMKTQYYQDKVDYNKIISFLNLRIYTNEKVVSDKNNWGYLWEQKNDYFEYLMSQIGQKHPNLRESFSYYIGLGETSIQLVNMINKDNIPKIIAHKRIKSTDSIFEIYNPINFIIDNRVRDVAEYFKSAFFNNKDIINDLNSFLLNTNLTESEYLLFLARMLYPTYYFDIFEDIINDHKDEEEIKKITDLVDNYEVLLKQIYSYYKTKINIMPIEWLES